MTSEMQYTGLWDIRKSQLADAFMIKNPPAQPTRVCNIEACRVYKKKTGRFTPLEWLNTLGSFGVDTS